MAAESLRIDKRPKLQQAQMIFALSGWMDGGDVSTGTVEWLVRSLDAEQIAEIVPDEFYIYNFPGSMEISALFRPETKIEDGLIQRLDYPANLFFCHPENNLILFSGKEPNIRWEAFGECVFRLAEAFEVKRMYFIGSVAGTTPHTREPRLFCSASNPQLRDELHRFGVRSSSYEGPASFTTHLIHNAEKRSIQMASLVAEIPAYVQGTNPIAIESVARRLAAMLGLQVRLDELRHTSDAFEKELSDAIQEKADMVELVQKLEQAYDNEMFDTQMGDLKQWLRQQGIEFD